MIVWHWWVTQPTACSSWSWGFLCHTWNKCLFCKSSPGNTWRWLGGSWTCRCDTFQTCLLQEGWTWLFSETKAICSRRLFGLRLLFGCEIPISTCRQRSPERRARTVYIFSALAMKNVLCVVFFTLTLFNLPFFSHFSQTIFWTLLNHMSQIGNN